MHITADQRIAGYRPVSHRLPELYDGRKGRRRPFECSNTHALLTPSQCATSFAPRSFSWGTRRSLWDARPIATEALSAWLTDTAASSQIETAFTGRPRF